MSARILNSAQAEAIYSAMCALNNVGMRLSVRVDEVRVWESESGEVFVQAPGVLAEIWESQGAFCDAYELQGVAA